MSRLIDADRLKEALLCDLQSFQKGTIPEYIMGWIETEIDECPTVTNWIPVSERLPENESYVLAALDDGFAATVGYTGDWELWDDSGEVIAWMPLPEPYKPEGGVDT